jgi:tetrahydromethanopterin S-methyltransferase subunit B
MSKAKREAQKRRDELRIKIKELSEKIENVEKTTNPLFLSLARKKLQEAQYQLQQLN